MSTDPDRVVIDFVRASQLFAHRDTAAALTALLPGGLTKGQLVLRIQVMLALGAVLAGAVAGPGGQVESATPVQRLAAQFVDAGAQLDAPRIQDLITGRTVEDLVDVLVELASRFAAQDRTPR